MRGLGPFLKDAWRLAKPYFVSEERWSARGLLAAIILLNLSMVGMTVVLNFWNRAIYNALQDKDWASFVDLLFWYRRGETGIMPGFCEIVVVYIVVAVYRTYLNQWLQIRWRRWLTTRFLNEWLTDRAYYRISLTSTGTDNPDQRIAEDLRDFVAESLALSLDLLSNIVTLFSFLTILWTLSGPLIVLGVSIPGYMLWVALIYSIFGTVLAHVIGRPLVALSFRKQQVEADFRFALVRLRENVEGVALYEGEADEKASLGTRFGAVIGNWWAIMQRTKFLNSFIYGFNQVAGVFPLVVAAPGYFAGRTPLGGLFQTLDAFGQVQGALSWFVGAYSTLATWRATVERLLTFHRAILAAHLATQRGEGVANAHAQGPDYELHAVTLTLPNGHRLLEPTELRLEPGQSVVITGRSGAGKSTLFRALAGIWPFGGGRVARPAGASLFLPQRPYIPLGTLRHAVTYPAAAKSYDGAEIRGVLEDVGLGHLLPRLDADENWTQVLSGGEQQRLAVARALLARPAWLFLDEATANLDPPAEAELYALMQQRLPGTALVSIAHRPSVAALHSRRLVFAPRADGPGHLTEEAAAAAD